MPDGTEGFLLDKIVFSGMERSGKVKKSNLWERKVTMTLSRSLFLIQQISYSCSCMFILCIPVEDTLKSTHWRKSKIFGRKEGDNDSQ